MIENMRKVQKEQNGTKHHLSSLHDTNAPEVHLRAARWQYRPTELMSH